MYMPKVTLYNKIRYVINKCSYLIFISNLFTFITGAGPREPKTAQKPI